MSINTNGNAPHQFGDEEQRFHRLKVDLHERLISGIDLNVARRVENESLRQELRRAAEDLCRKEADLLSKSERDRLVDEVLYEAFGMGPLEPLMHDATISDILINGPYTIYVERQGKLERTQVCFRDLDHLIGIVQRIAGQAGRRIDESSPMVDARLPDGSRFNAVLRPLALEGALVSIRRFGNRPLSEGDLIAKHSATVEMIDFLEKCVRSRLNIVISGGTGSGKTTLLNLLSKHVSTDERIVTIEDAAELNLQQPHVARIETRPPNVEGKGEVTSRDLLKNALRMRPDRIIIGECRGVEAFDMLQAMSTGHDGGMTTIHANDARDAISRLEMLIGMGAPELPMWFINRQIATAIDIVVHTARISGGKRKIVQIAEVTGLQGETVNMHNLFEYVQTGVDASGTSEGYFEATGIRPECSDRLARLGHSVSPTLFARGRQEIDRLDAMLAH